MLSKLFTVQARARARFAFMVLSLGLLSLLSTFVSAHQHGQGHANEASEDSAHTTTIAFGSCAVEDFPQPIWADIAKQRPDAFLFIGDNVYADVREVDGKLDRSPVSDPAEFTTAYQTLSKIPEFAAFRQQVPVFLGTWDDHDYGKNDGGKEYPLKAESQQAFLDFFEVPKSSARRQRAGVYHAEMLTHQGNTVQLILLDTRYHRDTPSKNPLGRVSGRGPYIATDDPDKTVLGEEQWAWLEQQLMQPADVRIIVSSFQLIAHEHGWESWGHFPLERQRLYDLIAKTKAEHAFFLSGDRHLMEISKDSGEFDHQVPYPMWDFTASGMTQKFFEVNEPNRYRQGTVVRDTHYGMVELQWAEPLADTQVIMTAYGLGNNVFEQRSFRLGELTFN